MVRNHNIAGGRGKNRRHNLQNDKGDKNRGERMI